jgi:hypothetical protein
MLEWAYKLSEFVFIVRIFIVFWGGRNSMHYAVGIIHGVTPSAVAGAGPGVKR